MSGGWIEDRYGKTEPPVHKYHRCATKIASGMSGFSVRDPGEHSSPDGQWCDCTISPFCEKMNESPTLVTVICIQKAVTMTFEGNVTAWTLCLSRATTPSLRLGTAHRCPRLSSQNTPCTCKHLSCFSRPPLAPSKEEFGNTWTTPRWCLGRDVGRLYKLRG